MVPFLHTGLLNIIHGLLNRIVKPDVLKGAENETISVKLCNDVLVDCLKPLKEIDVGFGAARELRLHKDKLTTRQKRNFLNRAFP